MIGVDRLLGRSVGFTVIGEPKGAGSKIAGKTKSGRTFIRDDSGNAGRLWRKDVKAAGIVAMAGAAPFDGPLVVTMRFYVPRGSSVTRPMPTVRPDVLKLARSVEDALTGVVWDDDALIVGEMLLKLYGSPRLEIMVTAADATEVGRLYSLGLTG